MLNSSRILRVVIALPILLLAGWQMWGYTTDDTFIHLRYADNLLERGEFSFNPGATSYGATSPLWIFGLALLLKLGLSPFVSAWLLGVISSLGVILLLDVFLEKMSFSPLWRGMLLVLVVADPWFLRWSFSGMETPLATLLLLGLLYPLILPMGYRPQGHSPALWPRYLGWGVLAGLAGLTRPEFMILAPLALPLLLMFEYFRAGNMGGYSGRHWARPHKPILASVVGWFAVSLPWFIYAWASFGRITPGTASAKSNALSLNPTVLFPSLMQSVKTLAVGQGLLWVILLILAVLVLYNNRGNHRRNTSRWESSNQGGGDWSIWGPVVLVGIASVWVVVLLGGYAAKQVWIISRYVSPLAPVMFLALAVVAEWLLGGTQLQPSVRRAGARLIGLGVILTLAFNTWIMVDQVIPHARKFPVGVKECYLGFGEWLSQNSPAGSVVAALDIGAVGYASDRPVLDLMGLVSPEILVVGQEKGFQEMVEQAAWVGVTEITSGNRASYFIDRSEGQPRWDGITVEDVRFELLDSCIIEGVGLREPQPWTVALYRLVSTDTRVKSSAGG